jgi:hypothetical protein
MEDSMRARRHLSLCSYAIYYESHFLDYDQSINHFNIFESFQQDGEA